MNITILEASNLTSDVFLSVRVGETKRLRPFRVGESFSFLKSADSSGYVQFDAFEKLGSLMTGALHEPSGCHARDVVQDVSIPTARGTSIRAKIKVAVTDPPSSEKRDKSQIRHKLALDAKNYLDGYDVWGTIQGLLHAVLKQRPQDPVAFMMSYLCDLQRSKSRGSTVGFSAPSANSGGWGESPDDIQFKSSAWLPQQDARPDAQLVAEDFGPQEPSQAPADAKCAPEAEVAAEPARGLFQPEPPPAPPEAPPGRELEVAPSEPAEEACMKSAPPPAVAPETAPDKEPPKEPPQVLEELDNILNRTVPRWAGGNDSCPGTFPRDTCPEDMPDLSEHSSLMTDVLRRDPSIYGRLKDRRTQLGVNFASCVKSGMDNPGHPMMKTVGLVAGDEECYSVFRELFDPVIELRHGGYSHGAPPHPTDLDVARVSDRPIDSTGRYALSVRVRSSRSVSGIRLPTVCDRTERREVESALTRTLLRMQDEDLRGDYYPLRHSASHPAKPNGMSEQEEEELRGGCLLFGEPDAPVVLSAGTARHWPDARGVFASGSRQVVAWINEEDHLRLISLQVGGDLREAFGRFARCVAQIEHGLRQDRYAFARSEHLGYITSCPSNLGTGLRVNVTLRLPLLSRQPRFQEFCGSLGLLARSGLVPIASADTLGVCDISNYETLGLSEVDIVNKVIEGCAKLVAMEQELEASASAAP